MNKLTCQVTSCAHNEDCLCDLSKINVEGPGASSMEQTCCASFTEGGSNAAQNSCANGGACRETNIDCKAEHCTYNKNCKCTAKNVSVGCGCASPCVMSETECCTFSAR